VSVTLPAGVEMEIAATGERLVGPVACNRRLTPERTGE
jgi:hypothetical protein